MNWFFFGMGFIDSVIISFVIVYVLFSYNFPSFPSHYHSTSFHIHPASTFPSTTAFSSTVTCFLPFLSPIFSTTFHTYVLSPVLATPFLLTSQSLLPFPTSFSPYQPHLPYILAFLDLLTTSPLNSTHSIFPINWSPYIAPSIFHLPLTFPPAASLPFPLLSARA